MASCTVGNGTGSQCTGLGLEIDLGVDIGRIEGHVPQPSTDRIDIHTCKQASQFDQDFALAGADG
jgi:hypothetical protein